MNNKYKLLIIVVFALLMLITSIVFTLKPKEEKNESQSDTELGTIIKDESLAGELLITGDGEDEISTVNCSYTNMNILSTEYLPFGAFEKLNEQTWNWLVDNELSNVTEITIIKDSIQPNKSQPRFNCTLNNSSKIIVVTYSTIKQEFMFDFL